MMYGDRKERTLATIKLTLEIQVPYALGPDPSSEKVLNYVNNIGTYLYEDDTLDSLLKAKLTRVVDSLGEVLYEVG